MNIKYYEEKLKSRGNLDVDAETFWDQRASDFNDSQNKSGNEVIDEVINVFEAKGILKGASVIDIGGGAGRYAIPLAKKAEKVIMTDISTNMLKFAKENAEKENLHNLDYIKVDWVIADLEELGWNKKFDLVFASMCPATRQKDGIDKMTAASKGYCNINQLVVMTDDLTEHLKEVLEIKNAYDVHNDRETVEGIFNILWLQGYDPEIRFIKTAKTKEFTVEEAFSNCASRFLKTAEEKGMDLRKIIEDYAENGKITVNSKSHLAMISWEAKK